jgi:hypothetical protein
MLIAIDFFSGNVLYAISPTYASRERTFRDFAFESFRLLFFIKRKREAEENIISRFRHPNL